MLEERGARNFTFVCIIAAPKGVTIQTAHPSVRIVTAAIDDRLNDHGYIVPGLGDARRSHVRLHELRPRKRPRNLAVTSGQCGAMNTSSRRLSARSSALETVPRWV
jgi:hypothetical protein